MMCCGSLYCLLLVSDSALFSPFVSADNDKVAE